jgi:hypothetical protein
MLATLGEDREPCLGCLACECVQAEPPVTAQVLVQLVQTQGVGLVGIEAVLLHGVAELLDHGSYTAVKILLLALLKLIHEGHLLALLGTCSRELEGCCCCL